MFNLADYMHVPDGQARIWLWETNAAQTQARKMSLTDCENFFAVWRERRKLARRDTAEIIWKLEDFHRHATRHGLNYLGVPNQQGQVASSIPDLTDWLASVAVRLPALLTHTWDESYVPSHEPLQSLLWWKSDRGCPFQAQFCEVSENTPSHGGQLLFNLNAFQDFAKLLKSKYLGPLTKRIQVIDGQQVQRHAWQPDDTVAPEQSSSWPPWQRPVYWCSVERLRDGSTSTRHIFRSISELLENGVAAFRVNKTEYQRLAESLNYVFLVRTSH